MKHQASFFCGIFSYLHQMLHLYPHGLRRRGLQHQRHLKLHLHPHDRQQEQLGHYRLQDVDQLFEGTSPTMV